MITQEAIDAASSSSITSCTGIEACRISCSMSMSLPTATAASATPGSAGSPVAAAAPSSGSGATSVACNNIVSGIMHPLQGF